MPEIYLNRIAHGRSGDKGDTSNVCIFARKPRYFEIIKREVTEDKAKGYFGKMVQGSVTRYEVESLKGFNFVMKHALGGGATHSLRMDSLGKSMGSAFMRMKITVSDEELAQIEADEAVHTAAAENSAAAGDLTKLTGAARIHAVESELRSLINEMTGKQEE